MSYKLTINLSRSTYRQLEREADDDDLSVERYAAEIIEEYFEDPDNPPDDSK